MYKTLGSDRKQPMATAVACCQHLRRALPPCIHPFSPLHSKIRHAYTVCVLMIYTRAPPSWYVTNTCIMGLPEQAKVASASRQQASCSKKRTTVSARAYPNTHHTYKCTYAHLTGSAAWKRSLAVYAHKATTAEAASQTTVTRRATAACLDEAAGRRWHSGHSLVFCRQEKEPGSCCSWGACRARARYS